MPNRGIYILLFFIFWAHDIRAQTLSWANIFTGNPTINNIKSDNEGNLIVAGVYGPNDSLNRRPLPKFKYNLQHRGISFLAKFDTAGHLLWMDTTSSQYEIWHIEISTKGDYFFSGSGYDTGTAFHCLNPPTNNSKGFIGKCDRNGRMYWIRKYIDYHVRPANSGWNEGILNFKVDSMESIYFMAAIPNAPDYMVINTVKYPNSTDSGIYLAKFDSNGKFKWLNTGVNDVNTQFGIDLRGNIYCFTNYKRVIGIYPPTVINKYNYSGKLVKQLVFDSTDKNVELGNIAIDRYNSIYVNMSSIKDFTLNGQTYHNSSGGQNSSGGPYLFKLDSGFNVIWALNAGGTISINKGSDYLYLSDYNYQGQVNINGQSTHNSIDDTIGNSYFVKINQNGSVIWIKNTTYSKIEGFVPIIIEDKCDNFFVTFNFSKLHFNGLNIGSNNPNFEGSVIAKFSSDSLGFVNQNSLCGLSLKNISNPIFTHYRWYAKDVGDTTIGKLISTSKDLNYSFPHKHKYIITLLAIKSGGCTNTVQDTFTVPGSPFAGFAAADTQGCQYVQFLFSDTSHADTINAAPPGAGWYWDFGDGSASLTYTKTKRPIVSHIYTQSGTYTVKLVYSNGLCTDTFISQKKVVIIPAPKPGFTVSDTVGCVPLNLNVTDGSVGAVDKWVYTIRKVIPLPPSKGDSFRTSSFSYTFSAPGMYILHQYLTGPTGCVTEDSVMINVTPVFDGSEKADMYYVTVDADNTIKANWYAFPGALNYALYRYADNDSANAELLTQTTQNSFRDINADPVHHSYIYYIEAQDGCGHYTSHGRIGKTIKLSGFENGNLLPQLAWTAYKDWPGWTNNYEILRQDPGLAYKYTGRSLDTSFVDTALTARDVYGECYRVRTLWNDTSPVSFSNIFCFGNTPQIYIPNIFTPDGNNLNDVFAPVFTGIKSYSMAIINRWGEKVYTSQSSPLSPSPSGEGRGEAFGWDGNFKGVTAPNGIYIYFIKAEDFNGNTITRKGMVMLQQ